MEQLFGRGRAANGVSTRPVACLAIADHVRREELAEQLREHGWAVFAWSSGYELLRGLSPALLREEHWLRPGLIVADAISAGCAGSTIARGLRELGWPTVVVLLAQAGQEARVARETGAISLPETVGTDRLLAAIGVGPRGGTVADGTALDGHAPMS